MRQDKRGKAKRGGRDEARKGGKREEKRGKARKGEDKRGKVREYMGRRLEVYCLLYIDSYISIEWTEEVRLTQAGSMMSQARDLLTSLSTRTAVGLVPKLVISDM